MARIEKTIFISYRRTDVYTALAVYENLKNQGYDVFFDYRSISSGDFEQIITSNIRARAHFLLILTPTALDRCSEPGDWLRHEIEIAIDERRNIVPLFFKGFRFGLPTSSGKSKWFGSRKPPVSDTLTGKLKSLSRYNGLNVHEDYFDEAMHRLRTEYLNKPLDTVLHPVSTEVRNVVKEEQIAADAALEQIEDIKELVKQGDGKPDKLETEPDQKPIIMTPALAETLLERQTDTPAAHVTDISSRPGEIQTKPKTVFQEVVINIKSVLKRAEIKAGVPQSRPEKKISISNQNFRLIGGIAGGVLLLGLLIWGGVNVFQNQPSVNTNPTRISPVVARQTSQFLETNTPSSTKTTPPTSTQTFQPVKTNTPSPTKTSISPTSMFEIGSTMTGKDGMTLLYVPAGGFIMGSEDGRDDEKPIHTVYVDDFWIDQTEVTNAMFAEFLASNVSQISVEDDEDVIWAGNTIYDLICHGAWCSDWVDRIKWDGNSFSVVSGYGNHPVAFVSWYGADEYCSWADRRLPAEAEWEKAARGTDGRTYPWGSEWDVSSTLRLNFADKNLGWGQHDSSVDDGYAVTSPVGNYPDGKSPYGAYDMAGNLWEWVADFYSSYYYLDTPLVNPTGPSSGEDHVLRGVSFSDVSLNVRTYRRHHNPTYSTFNFVGFRCAMDASP